jgi:hypothetical protein
MNGKNLPRIYLAEQCKVQRNGKGKEKYLFQHMQEMKMREIQNGDSCLGYLSGDSILSTQQDTG